MKLVERSDEEDCVATRLVGTPGYLPPELVFKFSFEYDLQSDQPVQFHMLYSLYEFNTAGQFLNFT